ncbi:melanotransferrin-like [Pieris napi]|uniref:melanotransferrin-like n=1 Tax=Pieris napi TaxID=78633 RepID=UPI001FBA267F|nr:melanotransferrin-like [Pieris napi]
MGVNFLLILTVIGAASAQFVYRVCVPISQKHVCQRLEVQWSAVKCELVESKIDCALKLSRGEADLGVLSEEEVALIPQHASGKNFRIVGSIRDVSRSEPFAFEAVAVVSSSHTGGLEGLRGGRYCHPGLDEPELRWSPRVSKFLEKKVAETDRCPDANTDGKTAEEMEVEAISQFFNSACRPGPWSANSSVDADLMRNIPPIDASPSCIPARRWCTISESEHSKCLWVQLAAHTLGIEPAISCQLRRSIFECFAAIKDNTADFIAAPANYGFMARQYYGLLPVKLVQNLRNDPRAFSRVVTLLRASSSISSFENLRGKNACFPEFGGISYVAFIRAAQENGVISRSECDYARAVGEFFGGACAPGALNASQISASNYDVKSLCSLCKPADSVAPKGSKICSYDSTNKYYGNAGAVACLADPERDVAFVELENIDANLKAAGLEASQIRVLRRNNTLALSTGVSVDSNCLLADVVDSEVLTRRNDPLLNSLNALLDTLDVHFGYFTDTQLINLPIYSPFDGVNDLLFKNTVVGLTEPTSSTVNEAARNYHELFQHLDSCVRK